MQLFFKLIGESVIDKHKPPFPYYPKVIETDVGPERTGEILVDLRPSHGVFVIKEDGTDYRPCVVQDFTDPEVFNALRVGTRVKFRITLRLPRVVSIAIIS